VECWLNEAQKKQLTAQLLEQSSSEDKLMLIAMPNEEDVCYSKQSTLLFNKSIWVIS